MLVKSDEEPDFVFWGRRANVGLIQESQANKRHPAPSSSSSSDAPGCPVATWHDSTEPGAEQQDQGAPTCGRTCGLDRELRSLRTLGGEAAAAAAQGRPDCSFWGRAPRAVRQSAGRLGGGGCGDLWYFPPSQHYCLTSISSWKYYGESFNFSSMVTVAYPPSIFSPVSSAIQSVIMCN